MAVFFMPEGNRPAGKAKPRSNMNTDERTWLEQVVNVHIVRERRRVSVGFGNVIDLLEREYLVLEYLMRDPDLTKWHSLHDIARGAFPKTEMVPISAVRVILEQAKRTLVAHRASRGFLKVPRRGYVQLYAPEPSVKVTAFHVPGSRYESGPATQTFTDDEVTPVWEGQITEKADFHICGDVHQFLNRDDRPNGRFAPSLSVGDLVTIAGDTPEAVTYQVANGAGWIRLKTPVNANPDAIKAMREQLRGPQTVALNT